MEPTPQEEFPNKLGEWIDWMRRKRPVLAAVAVLPVAITIVIALLAQPLEPEYVFPCPLYPNATIAFTSALHESCPLEYPDQIDAVVRDERVDLVRRMPRSARSSQPASQSRSAFIHCRGRRAT